MGNIREKRPKEGSVFNLNEKLYGQSLNKKFGTHVKKYMVFRTFKNKQCIIPRNKVISGKCPWGLRIEYFPKVKDPKTGKYIHKVFGIHSETSLLINCRKFSSLATENLGEFVAQKQYLNSTKLLPVNTYSKA